MATKERRGTPFQQPLVVLGVMAHHKGQRNIWPAIKLDNWTKAIKREIERRPDRYRNRNRKLQTSKAPLKSQAQGTSLFTSAASNQRGFPKNSPWEAQVRFPEGERMRQIRGVFQRIVRG